MACVEVSKFPVQSRQVSSHRSQGASFCSVPSTRLVGHPITPSFSSSTVLGQSFNPLRLTVPITYLFIQLCRRLLGPAPPVCHCGLGIQGVWTSRLRQGTDCRCVCGHVYRCPVLGFQCRHDRPPLRIQLLAFHLLCLNYRFRRYAHLGVAG